MKRYALALSVAAMLASLGIVTHAAGRFDQKLPVDKQIIHVLNRLTFGPRAGDVEQVRRLGLEKWIDLQLHPDRITENPDLEGKLKPLQTLQMLVWQINEKFLSPGVAFRPPIPFTLLTQKQRGILDNCSPDERLTLLNSLTPEVRRTVLGGTAPQTLEGLPEDLKQEAASLRQAYQQELQMELRKRNPPLADLLTPDQVRIANRGTHEEKLSLFNSLDAEKRKQVFRVLQPQSLNDFPDLSRESLAVRQPQQFVNFELMENKLLRATYSNRQLEEVLVDFWMNHFNIYNGKGQDRVLLTGFERDAIRPYVFGHFKDMLLATARHPAMLLYLDNYQSQVTRDDFPQPPDARRPGLNENYGRELMELHTLGVNGGYTQDDVIAVARAFTGWTIYDATRFGEFQFNPFMHDRKEKVVLGHTIPAMGAEQDGLAVIDILAHHPSTAKFISKKLAQRFVADDPPQTLIDRMAETFTKTDGDLRAVLQTMLSSVEFMSEGAWQSKLKSPLEMTVSAVRAVNADVTDTFQLTQRIADLGQPLYGKLEPTGYPNTGESWANTAGLLGRINFATALVASQIPGLKVDVSRFNFKTPAAVATELLGVTPSASMIAAIEKGIQGKEVTPSSLTTLILSSPDFQKR
jgi:uncharacterized protein (DUF1800 family)